VQYQKIKSWYLRYERVLMPATLVVGFFTDYLTFTNIQIHTTLTILSGYWLLALFVIIFIHLYDGERLTHRLRYVRLFAPLAIQFLFGALLGGSFIFYWFSGSISVSWPIIGLFVVLMLSNDGFRHYLENPFVQMGVYSFITLSLLSVLLPFWQNSLSPSLFVLAGCISVVVIGQLIVLISYIRRYQIKQKLLLFIPMLAVVSVMNIFYFANIIPPIPLLIREAGVYHSVVRSGGLYKLTGEAESGLQKFLPGQALHLTSAERAYVYSAIFAPAQLHTTIVHRWQYFDEAQGEWIEKDVLSFAVSGGRKEGYRGYSWKSNVAAGKWRVDIATERGQVLGRVRFTVIRVDEPVPLVEVIK
jgi:hypothetical protein